MATSGFLQKAGFIGLFLVKAATGKWWWWLRLLVTELWFITSPVHYYYYEQYLQLVAPLTDWLFDWLTHSLTHSLNHSHHIVLLKGRMFNSTHSAVVKLNFFLKCIICAIIIIHYLNPNWPINHLSASEHIRCGQSFPSYINQELAWWKILIFHTYIF